MTRAASNAESPNRTSGARESGSSNLTNTSTARAGRKPWIFQARKARLSLLCRSAPGNCGDGKGLLELPGKSRGKCLRFLSALPEQTAQGASIGAERVLPRGTPRGPVRLDLRPEQKAAARARRPPVSVQDSHVSARSAARRALSWPTRLLP